MPPLLYESLAPDFTVFTADQSLPPSPSLADAVAYALQKCPGFKFLPSNYDSLDTLPPNASPVAAHFSCDDFRMYEFKVRRCMRGRSHDWTECPFAHPGEKARRRDPRRIHYSGSPCPEFRKGSCRRGDSCEFAHGVFECWLHPARYRTQVCKDGKNCKRRVCFFAHSPQQLRILPVSVACVPVSSQAQAEKAGACKSSAENLSSPEVSMSSSIGMSRGLQFNSSSAMSAPASSASISMHLDSANGSALRRAMVQNFLACKGYGAHSSAKEYFPGLDRYEGLSEARMAHNSSFGMQLLHAKNHQNESLLPKFNLPLETNSYELASHSHGFASPTSTLAGHVFSPPPLSPPLSPLTSPNSNQNKMSFINPINDCHNHFVDDRAVHLNNCGPTYMHHNLSNVEDLGFGLQNLQIADSSEGGYVLLSPQLGERAVQAASYPMQQSRQPFFKHLGSNLSCTSKQALWGSADDFFNSSSGELDLLQGDVFGSSKIGEESTNMDNLVPDLGWVSELVK
ncbi:hypothetical protein L7F22_034328 [Adiantum nelumboides]|nr:hypothetical protein [Adiantum nelumboides]